MLTTLFKSIFYIFLILLGNFLLSSELEISADELKYKFNYLIIASGNVQLNYQKIALNSKYAEVDTRTNEFVAVGGINVNIDGNIFNTDVVTYKLEKDQLTFSAMSATFNPIELEAPLYFTSKVINKDGEFFYGEDVSFSTCPYDRQYYVIEAKKFKFYPNNKIIGYDVYCHSGAVPVFYSPYYEFKLGYMNPILLFPIIGKNLIEGDYVKTALDYYHDEDFNTLIYIDYLQKLGWGLGLNAKIRENRFNPSTAYFYYINSERYTFKWDQTIKLPDETFKYGFQQRNLHNISGAYDKFSEGYLNYLNRDIGEIYIYNKDNRQYSQKNEKYSWRGNLGAFNNTVQLNQDSYTNTGGYRRNFNFSSTTSGFNNNFNYSSNLNSNKDYYQYYNNNLNLNPITNLQLNANLTYKNDLINNENDELFNPKLGFTYRLYDALLNLNSVSLRTDLLIDVDGDRVTKDNKISILESLPEFDLNFNNLSYGIFSYTPKITVGNYHERRFIDDTYGNRDITFKRILINNDFNADIIKNDFAYFKVAYGYNQYLYETQDKQYGLNETYQLDILNGNPIKNSVKYVQYHNGGYTPFYFDEMSSYVNKRLNNIFVYQITDKTTLQVRDGYDFINRKRDLEYFDLRHILNTSSTITLFTGFDHENSRWQNLQSNVSLQENQDNYLIWRMNYELISGMIRDNRVQIGKSIGTDEPWKVRSEIVYNYVNKQYTMPFIDIIRDMGCVELIYRYREYNREHTFLFRVNAFPDQTFGTTIGDVGTTFKGWEQQDVSR